MPLSGHIRKSRRKDHVDDMISRIEIEKEKRMSRIENEKKKIMSMMENEIEQN
jgi:hypothetical protein